MRLAWMGSLAAASLLACSASNERVLGAIDGGEPRVDAGGGATGNDAGADETGTPEAGVPRRLETNCEKDPCYLAVSGNGAEHLCGLLRDGTVRCWGRDGADGTLGRGHAATAVEGAKPAPVTGLTGVAQISVGKNRGTCARTSDGAVYCWGRNEYGQLGRPKAEVRLPVPTRVEGLPPVSSVALGGSTGCAIASDDGALYCWGALASPNEDAPAQPPQRMVDFPLGLRSVTLGTYTFYRQYGDTIVALRKDDVLACLGEYPAGETSVLRPVSSPLPVDQTGVARGFEFAYVTTDGLLRQWMPSERTLYVPDPSSVIDAAVTSKLDISGSPALEQGAVLLASGRLFRWGLNVSATLGTGPELLDFAEQPRDMTPVVGGSVVSFATTRISTCVSLVDGKIKCWGGNEHGELGRGTLDGAAHPEAEEIQ